MSAVDQADRLLMDHKAPVVITEAMQAELTRQLNADFDKLSATALRIRDERDELARVLLAIYAEVRDDGKGERPYSADSYLPPKFQEQIRAALTKANLL